MNRTIKNYTHVSRFTDPMAFEDMLLDLPDDIEGILEIAKNQTIHHNLLVYNDVPFEHWKSMPQVWPPRFSDILSALMNIEPYILSAKRKAIDRVIGACMLEAHFLGGLLRSKSIPVRMRGGYFTNIRSDHNHIVNFWRENLTIKNQENPSFKENPEQWIEKLDILSQEKNAINHHIEHWVCEYWDSEEKKWVILDANDNFLKAHSNLDVGFYLPKHYFEYASEAWIQMRSTHNFNPKRYEEDPQDGQSHIRTQLLRDYFSLLSYDLPGFGEEEPSNYKFIHEKNYNDLTSKELMELDKLAKLLKQDPPINDLVEFYLNSKTIKLKHIDNDPYNFVFN